MTKLITKRIQTYISDYFSTTSSLTKPETRCLKDMTVGILKSKSIFVNQIAASLRESLKLKDTCKRLSGQYLKDDYAEDVRKNHLEITSSSVAMGDFILMDGTDNQTLKDFFFTECLQAIIRLKKNTKLEFENEELQVSKLIGKTHFSTKQTVTKVKKNKPVKVQYELGAIPVHYTINRVKHSLWLVVSRNLKHGGLCYLLVKSLKTKPIDVALWAFRGYGLRWKIEEYHRHVKQAYKLEYTQMKTFDGLQSILAILTVAMFMIYKRFRAIHFNLLLDAGYNYLNKNTVGELINFIYYKISKVVSHLLIATRSRWKVGIVPPDSNNRQLQLVLR